MAVGDPVIQRGADNTILDYQPAAGVTTMILCTGNGSNSDNFTHLRIYDGTNVMYITPVATVKTIDIGQMKILVDNTYYLRLNASGAGTHQWFCGIQIK